MNSNDFAGHLKTKIRGYENEIVQLTARVDALLAKIEELESLRNSARILWSRVIHISHLQNCGYPAK